MLPSDRDTASIQLDAVMAYYGKVKGHCIAKPESYEARRERRAAEIAGLKGRSRMTRPRFGASDATPLAQGVTQ